MESLIEEYGSGYKMLREAIEGLSEDELRFKPASDKWSIHQILIHMADSEMVSTQRLKKVLSEEEPLLMSIDQDAWANALGYEQLDREQYLLLFQLLRSSMLPILAQLTSEQFERVGNYADAGRFTFKELLEYRVQHVRGHLAQIKQVKKVYRKILE
ncbi:DinB family protein [Paenisporosarcina sp. OV554]|uniref:DinB family protein n=1 Tax=Paenisporosarcina sp. OV554 TaxID=2135694 RepID=UPI000D37B7AC|nr:DinB family protein [Paenisporosarcina sp. OV554]PUB04350.1 DinB family protein [Paenisporosarcina sp. OV554]